MDRVEIVNTAATLLAMVSKPMKWVEASTEGKNATLIEFFLPNEVKEALDQTAESSPGGVAHFESSLFLYVVLKGFELLTREAQRPEGMKKILVGALKAKQKVKEELDGISKP